MFLFGIIASYGPQRVLMALIYSHRQLQFLGRAVEFYCGSQEKYILWQALAILFHFCGLREERT